MTKMYELYHCIYKDEVVYIGQGAEGRHRHCNSGCSHVFGLNKIYFTEGSDTLEVRVIDVRRSRNEILRLEKEHIKLHRPKFNVVYTENSNNKSVLMAKAKSMRKSVIEYPNKKGGIKSDIIRQRYEDLCREFFDFYPIQEIIDNNIKFYSPAVFKRHERYMLSKLSKNIRHIQNKSSYHSLFESAIQDLYGVDLAKSSCSLDGKSLI